MLSELRSVQAFWQTIWKKTILDLAPGQVVIQVTDLCNARCPQCAMRKTEKFNRATLPREDIFDIIDAAGQKGVKAISFTGGEPFLMLEDLMACLKRAGDKKLPFIRTGTNGFFFARSHKPGFTDRVARLAEKLSQTRVRNFWISIDSCDPETHSRMRGFDGLFDGIRKALPIFSEHGIYPSANLGINRNLGAGLTRDLDPRDFSDPEAYGRAVYQTYSQGFANFYQTVIDLGFTIANACYPMSVDEKARDLSAVYQASAQDHVIKFSGSEKARIFKALMDTIPRYRDRIRIFSPLCSLDSLVRTYSGQTDLSYPCQGGINYFFIDAATGHTFPCGYRGQDNFGKFEELDRSKIDPDGQCRLCDWECFRDPSELFGPILDLLTAPVSLGEKIIRDPNHFRLWLSDLRYYRACDYFNGRKAPDYDRMARFASKPVPAGADGENRPELKTEYRPL